MFKNELEIPNEFREDFYKSLLAINIQGTKIVTLLGAILVPLFFITGIDYIFAPQDIGFFFYLRMLVGLECFLIYLLTKRENFANYIEWFAVVAYLSVGLVFAIMIRTIGYESRYYEGLNLVYLSTIIVSFGAKKALLTCIIIYSFYLVPILLFDLDNINWKLFIANNQFQIYYITIVAVANYLLTHIRQTEILNRLKIEKQNKELEAAQMELISKEKLASIGEISACMAHEIRTPSSSVLAGLYSINKTVDVLKRKHSDEDSGQLLKQIDGFVQNSESSVKKIEYIITSLLNFSRKNKQGMSFVNIHEGIDAVLNILNFNLLSKVNVYKEYKCLIQIQCDLEEVNHVFMNIIKNSYYAICEKYGNDEKGNLWIKTWDDKENVCVSIANDGVVLDINLKEKIFESFYSTKKQEGVGLGLAIAERIMDKHKGRIDVSVKDGVTEFIVEFPKKYT